MFLRKIYRWFELPHRIAAIKKYLGFEPKTLLDVGCGNHSPTVTKDYFPEVAYDGVDNSDWNNTDSDKAKINKLFVINLEESQALEADIPENYYDVLICSHVLEHIERPYETLLTLLKKIRPGGIIYIESPNKRSMSLPSAKKSWYGIHGCLNFEDDPTHKTMIDSKKVEQITSGEGLTTLHIGPRRMYRRIFFLPLYAIMGVILRGYVPASVVWDVTRFADTLVARKPTRNKC
jgi:2-polyprenyl-3-methyl-5-hydroxy-6-metoxy-1,4-benzoquinol methylase